MGRLPCLPQSTHTAKGDRSRAEDPPLEGALGPQSSLRDFTSPLFAPASEQSTCTRPGGGVTGSRQRGRRPAKGGGVHRCGLSFQIKRVSNNIQQKGSTVHPVERCRGASKDGEVCLLKLHFVSFSQRSTALSPVTPPFYLFLC